jgi:methylenetetrahydrofolate dehydrogenase (NADP+) / methenyltetrahydrofolate cyclohydrolase
MKVIDGKAVAKEIKNELINEVATYQKTNKRTPHLAAIILGDNPASHAYVANKVKSCADVGFKSTLKRFDASFTENDLLREIEILNNDPDIDGFIVQLPLPSHINETNVMLAIKPSKDVDGFHPVNVGRMALGLPCFLPATPFGITKILERYNIETSGKHVVVIGRSNIVGTPISIMLSRKGPQGDATVTLVHSRTKNLQSFTLQADILIAAIGIPNFVKANMVKRGAAVLDVGINRVEDSNSPTGTKLVGDVDFDEVKDIASHLTPVPGGVGPMTVMGLLINTMKAAQKTIYPS